MNWFVLLVSKWSKLAHYQENVTMFMVANAMDVLHAALIYVQIGLSHGWMVFAQEGIIVANVKLFMQEPCEAPG